MLNLSALYEKYGNPNPQRVGEYLGSGGMMSGIIPEGERPLSEAFSFVGYKPKTITEKTMQGMGFAPPTNFNPNATATPQPLPYIRYQNSPNVYERKTGRYIPYEEAVSKNIWNQIEDIPKPEPISKVSSPNIKPTNLHEAFLKYGQQPGFLSQAQKAIEHYQYEENQAALNAKGKGARARAKFIQDVFSPIQNIAESTTPGEVVLGAGRLAYKALGKSSPVLSEKDINTPAFAKLAINLAGFSSDIGVIGEFTAPMSTTVATKLLGSAGKLSKYGIALRVAKPFLARVIQRIPQEAMKFGARALLYELGRQIEHGQYSPSKLAIETGKGIGFGTLVGLPMAAATRLKQAIGTAGVFGGWSAVEKLLHNHEITARDVPEIALNAGVGLALGYIGSKQYVDAYKRQIIADYQNTEAVRNIQKTLHVDEQTAIRLHDLNAKANALKITYSKNPIVRDLRNKLLVATGEFKGSYVVKTGGAVRTPSSLKKLNLDRYLTTPEKVILEQLNLYGGPVPESPILTPNKPAYVQYAKFQFARDAYPFRMSKDSPSAYMKIREDVPTAIEALTRAIHGHNLSPIAPSESLGQTLMRWGSVLRPKGKDKIQVRDATRQIEVGKDIRYKRIESPFPEFKGFKDLSTKILSQLEGRRTVSRQFIHDLTRQQGISKNEKEVINEVLNEYSGVGSVPVREFAEKVKQELLPLRMKTIPKWADYNYIPEEQKGNITHSETHIWESPIKTSAGEVHFSTGKIENYFGHTRIEDLAGKSVKRTPSAVMDEKFTANAKGELAKKIGDTRRVTEIQSDLFQKGRLEKEIVIKGGIPHENKIELEALRSFVDDGLRGGRTLENIFERIKKARPDLIKKFNIKTFNDFENIIQKERNLVRMSKEYRQLMPYRNTWYQRIIREEIKKAAQDGKTKLRFPTGETAMKIEGLGEGGGLFSRRYGGISGLTEDDLKLGNIIYDPDGNEWIITDVLGDGKFKAVSKDKLTSMISYFPKSQWDKITQKQLIEEAKRQGVIETFDISRKVDTSNPIYRFYEGPIQKFLKRIRPDLRRITDEHGVTWFETTINDSDADLPVFAYKKGGNPHFDITEGEANRILSKFFSPEEVAFMSKDRLVDENGIPVWGRSTSGLIEVVRRHGLVQSAVLYHEAFHNYFNIILSEARREELLQEVYKRMATAGITMDRITAEEYLADEFSRYLMENDSFSVKVKRFFQRMFNRIKGWIGKEDKILQAFDDLISKKRRLRVEKEIGARINSPAYFLFRAPSAIHLLHTASGKEINVYAPITPQMMRYLRNEVRNIPWGSGDYPHLTPLRKLKGNARRVSLKKIMQLSPNARKAIKNAQKWIKRENSVRARFSYKEMFSKKLVEHAKSMLELLPEMPDTITMFSPEDREILSKFGVPATNVAKEVYQNVMERVAGVNAEKRPQATSIGDEYQKIAQQQLNISPAEDKSIPTKGEEKRIQQDVNDIDDSLNEIEGVATEFSDVIERAGAGNFNDYMEYLEMREAEEAEKEMAKLAAQEMASYGNTLLDIIRSMGGVKTEKGLEEEYSVIPLYLRNNKTGRPLDELVDELAGYGFHFQDAEQLRGAIQMAVADKKDDLLATWEETMEKPKRAKKRKETKVFTPEQRKHVASFLLPKDKKYEMAFGLSGNKQSTVFLFRSLYSHWASNGVDTIIEPYGGAFTLGMHAIPSAIQNGLKNYYVNIWEKYHFNVLRALQEERITDPAKEVRRAMRSISEEILKSSRKYSVVNKSIHDFLTENPRSFIGSRKWVEWINKRIGAQVSIYEDLYQQYREVFQSAINNIFDKNPQKLSVAMQQAVLQRIGVHAGRGQKFLSVKRFRSVERTLFGSGQMVDGLQKIIDVFNLAKKKGVNIIIGNKDGAEFINDIDIPNPKNVGYYLDPPYIGTAGVYDISNNNKAQFESPQAFLFSHQKVFDMLKKGARVAITNENNPDYLQLLLDKNIGVKFFGYQENVTPTLLTIDKQDAHLVRDVLSRDAIPTTTRIRTSTGITSVGKIVPGPNQLAMIVETAPEPLATNAQKALAHIAARKKGLSERQYKLLAKVMTGKSSMRLMSEQEAKTFISAIRGIVPGFRGPRISRSLSLLPANEAAEKLSDIGIMSKVASPKRVFRSIGNVAYDHIYEPIITAIEQNETARIAVASTIYDWRKALGITTKNVLLNRKRFNEQAERLTDYLDGKDVQLSLEEELVAKQMREFLNKYADRIDEDRKRRGLPPMNRRKHYITHLVNESIRYALRNRMNDASFMAILNKIIPTKVFNRFLLRRNEDVDLPIEKNIWKILRVYSSVAERQLAFNKVLPEVARYKTLLPVNAQRYTTWFVNSILGRPSQMDVLAQTTLQKIIDKVVGTKEVHLPIETSAGIVEETFRMPRIVVSRRPLAKMTNKAKMLTYMSFIGSNIHTMIVNLTQPIGTMASLPGNVFDNVIDMAKGYSKALLWVWKPSMWAKAKESGILEPMDRLLREELGVGSVLADFTMWNMKVSEFINRVASSYAAKSAFERLAKRRGINLLEKEAMAMGIELSNLINFKYGTGYKPQIFDNPIGNLFYQFNTFALKQAELLLDMGRKITNKDTLPQFLDAVRNGKGVEYLEKEGPPTRYVLLKYLLYATALASALSTLGIKVWDSFTKGYLPSQLEYTAKGTYYLLRGDLYNAMMSLGRAATPPALSGLYKGRGFIPMEVQLRRIRYGKNLMQKVGFEKINYPRKKGQGKVLFGTQNANLLHEIKGFTDRRLKESNILSP